VSADVERRRDELVREHGPWTAYNIDLGDGVFTIGPGRDGPAEERIDRLTRVVQDTARRPAADLRVLDLGCYEGGFGIAFGRLGAEVLGLEAREPHVRKAQFAADALGLDRVTFRQGDVRDLRRDEHGTFDVVLCLGILYHLDAPDCFDFLARVAGACTGFAVVETQVGLSGPRRERWRDREYRGLSYEEDVAHPGASRDNPRSFWMTRPSLLNLLADVGFTSVAEVLTPPVPAIDAFADHVVLLAHRGEGEPAGGRVAEEQRAVVHPAQGRRHRLRERLDRLRGGGMRRVFPHG
jgi:SAM-dependent methyltransferase